MIRPAAWVGDGPPGTFPAVVSEQSHEVLAAIRPGKPTSAFSADELDSAWVTAYTKWRALPPSGAIFELAARLCSPGMLVSIRDALDDPVRWFVDFGLDAVESLLTSQHPIGFPLALDVRLRHSGRGFREAAGKGLRNVAQRASSSISHLATEQFLAAAEQAGGVDPVLFEKLAADVIESVRKEGRSWPYETWSRLMRDRDFATAARQFVFEDRGRAAHFRPDAGELLTLEATAVLRPGDNIGVALELEAGWSEHLADHEIVQPFPQQV